MNIRNDLQTIQSSNQAIDGSAQISSPKKAPEVAGAVSAVAISDQTHVSVAASLVSQAASTSDVRSEKVQSIQAAIASGNYNVNATDVAGSLMAHMLGHQG